MALSVRITPVARDFEVMINEGIGAKARSAILAAFAAEKIEEAKAQNKQALGVVPPYDVYVDGREGAPLTSVKPDGVVRVEFDLINEAVAWIDTQLQLHSPVLTGRYARSHVLFADNAEASDPDFPPPAEEYAFVNTTPYARKIEGIRTRAIGTIRKPQSPQAPDGVYQTVATLAQRRFGNVARITFAYRAVMGGERNPAIIVRLR